MRMREFFVVLCSVGILCCATVSGGQFFSSDRKAFRDALGHPVPFFHLEEFAKEHSKSSQADTAQMILRWDEIISRSGSEASTLMDGTDRGTEYIVSMDHLLGAMRAALDSSHAVFLNLGIDVDGSTPREYTAYDAAYGRPPTYYALIEWYKHGMSLLDAYTRNLIDPKELARLWDICRSDSTTIAVLNFRSKLRERGSWDDLYKYYDPLVEAELKNRQKVSGRYGNGFGSAKWGMSSAELRKALGARAITSTTNVITGKSAALAPEDILATEPETNGILSFAFEGGALCQITLVIRPSSATSQQVKAFVLNRFGEPMPNSARTYNGQVLSDLEKYPNLFADHVQLQGVAMWDDGITEVELLCPTGEKTYYLVLTSKQYR